MKKVKKILLFIFLIPCFFALVSCANGKDKYVVSIEKTQSNNLTDTYTISYSNGDKNHIEITNGKDLSIDEVFNEAKRNGFNGSFMDFLSTYLKYDASNNVSYASNVALRSIVSIYCEFKVPAFSWSGGVQTQSSYSAGSGVIYSLDDNGNAYVITNYHVCYNESAVDNKISNNINLFLYGMELNNYAIKAKYVGGSMLNDIAVLKVENSSILKESDAKAVVLGNSNDIAVGETAIAVGNPEAEGISVTSGIISVDSEEIEMLAVDEKTPMKIRVLRVDTAINSGNSGGGLFNSKGELIGIVNAKIVDENIENIGYAIPINTAIGVAKNIVDNIDSNGVGSLKKCSLGISYNVSDVRVKYNKSKLRYEIFETVKIDLIANNSLAKRLKLNQGDVITKVILDSNEFDVSRSFIIYESLLNARVNNVLKIEYLRNSVKNTCELTLKDSDFLLVK